MTSLLDWIFPPRCAGCSSYGQRWCARCDATLTPLTERWGGLTLIAAGQLRGPWQRAIHEYKYRPRRDLAPPLATPLASAAANARLALDALVPIPLHPTRQWERGFNQAELLARRIAPALACGLAHSLKRVRPTLTQVGLDETARRANLQGAFHWEGPPPQGRLALVDDVLTTGATLEAAQAAVEAAGGHLVAVLLLAVRGEPRSPGAQTLATVVVTSEGKPHPF